MGVKIKVSNADYSVFTHSEFGRLVSMTSDELTIKSLLPSSDFYFYVYGNFPHNKLKITTPTSSTVAINTVSIGFDSVTKDMYVFYIDGAQKGFVKRFKFDGTFSDVSVGSYGAVTVAKGSPAIVEWGSTSLTVTDGVTTAIVPYADMPNFVPKILGGLVINNQTIAFDYEILP